MDRQALKLLIQKLKDDLRGKSKLFSWSLKFEFLISTMKLVFAKKRGSATPFPRKCEEVPPLSRGSAEEVPPDS
jgi:hypothetical protein